MKYSFKVDALISLAYTGFQTTVCRFYHAIALTFNLVLFIRTTPR